MGIAREEAVEKLLKSYQSYYNVKRCEESEAPLVATCDFFEHAQKYVLSTKAELWSADNEEFIYVFSMDNLTAAAYDKCKQIALDGAMPRIVPGPGHMASYITTVFLCDTVDADALKLLKRTRIYKSFHFSLHGWMDYHSAVVAFEQDNLVASNFDGRNTAKILKKVLFNKKRGKGEVKR